MRTHISILIILIFIQYKSFSQNLTKGVIGDIDSVKNKVLYKHEYPEQEGEYTFGELILKDLKSGIESKILDSVLVYDSPLPFFLNGNEILISTNQGIKVVDIDSKRKREVLRAPKGYYTAGLSVNRTSKNIIILFINQQLNTALLNFYSFSGDLLKKVEAKYDNSKTYTQRSFEIINYSNFTLFAINQYLYLYDKSINNLKLITNDLRLDASNLYYLKFNNIFFITDNIKELQVYNIPNGIIKRIAIPEFNYSKNDLIYFYKGFNNTKLFLKVQKDFSSVGGQFIEFDLITFKYTLTKEANIFKSRNKNVFITNRDLYGFAID